MVLTRARRVTRVIALGVPLAIAPILPSLSAQSRGVTIRGRVELPRPPGVTERRPSAGDLGEGPARDVVERRRAVVYFESAPKGAFEDRDGGHAAMDQRNETFVPHVLAVRTGTVVDFPNNDRIYHNVFSLSPTRRFDLGRYAVGRSKAVRFDRPGVVRVFCDIHSHMNAFIVVFAHRFFVVPQPDGEFQLPAVPPGTYTVAGWYEGDVRVSRVVTVRQGEATVVDLQVP
jgi:plastocyanin